MRIRVTNNVDRVARGLTLLMACVLLAGCAAHHKAYTRAEREMRRENWDEAVLEYSRAVAMDPGNSRYSVSLERAKLRAAADHFEKARRYSNAGQLELAVAELQQTLLLNPGNQHAATELQRAIRELRRQQDGPSEIERLKELVRKKDTGPPKLDPRSNIPILLDFKEVEVGKIFEAIGKASGINFIFDDKVDSDKPLTVDMGNVTLEKALDILMLQTKNFYKVIDDYTLLIAPDTRQKRQEYEDQVIRTFFLSNAETKTVVTLLRSLLQSRQIAENAELNSVTIKDTPPKVAIAERIIEANDKAKGEVLIDVELLEINRTLAQTLGIDLSSKTLTLGFGDGSESVPLNNLDVLREKGNWTVGVIPSVVINFLKSDSESRGIAKPQLRVSEGERAEILIGDRIPIPTTSFNTSQTVGGNIVPITSFTYQNVGITVQIEPRVHHNKEVTLTVQVEVSQVTGVVETGGGQNQPIIGTRQIQTVIRLRDGETNLLAGLIQRTNQDSQSGIPGLMDTPVLGKIFSNNSTNRTETDIVMTLTPRIVRIPNITEEDLSPLWVGTEENMQLRGAARSALNAGPFGRTDSGGAGAVGQDGGAGGGPSPGGGSVTTTASGGPGSSSVPAARRGLVPPEAADASNTSNTPAGGDSLGRLTGARTVTTPPAGDDPVEQATREAERGAFDEGNQDNQGNQGARDDPNFPADQDQQADSGRDENPGTPAVITLVPTKATFAVGEPVVVNVVISNGNNVGSTPFHLMYDKSVLQFISHAEGDFMRSDGAQTVFLAADTGGGGDVVVGLSRMGAPTGATGSGTLATFQFQAIGPGQAGFQFTGASVKDPQARNLPAAFNPAVVQVQP
ncbi:MAG: hypothetical protein GY716_09435 [bacterium]|nr:hypothetical protein [bacterium]